MSAMWGRKKSKTSDAASTPPTQATAKLDKVLVSSGNTKKVFFWNKWSKRRRIISGVVALALMAALVVGGTILIKHLRKKPEVAEPTPDEAKTQMLADYYQRRDRLQQQPSPEAQIEAQFKTFEDKITSNQAGADDNERFATYTQAAFLGARLKKTQAAKYAEKALEYSNTMDQGSKAASADLIKGLEVVAKGDYSAFTQ